MLEIHGAMTMMGIGYHLNNQMHFEARDTPVEAMATPRPNLNKLALRLTWDATFCTPVLLYPEYFLEHRTLLWRRCAHLPQPQHTQDGLNPQQCTGPAETLLSAGQGPVHFVLLY